MNILIGTHNVDKAILLESLLQRALPAAEIHLLSEFRIRERVSETGSLLSRATSKAFAYEREVVKRGHHEFELFVGVDDGISYVGQTAQLEDSKAIAVQLLKGSLPDGVRVTVHHAIALVSKDHKYASFIAKIPLIYERPKSPLLFREGKYPLVAVLRIPRHRNTLSSTLYSRYIDYYWSIVSSHLTHALRACGAYAREDA